MSTIKNFAKKVLRLKLLEKVGLSLINFDMLKSVKNYLWILKLPVFPRLKITYREKIKVSNEDILLCERLLKAYKEVNREKATIENKTSSLWAGTLKEKYCKIYLLLPNRKTMSVSLGLIIWKIHKILDR